MKVFSETAPANSADWDATALRDLLSALFQGDESALRVRAQASPNMTVAVSASVLNAFDKHVYGSSKTPVNYAGGNTGTFTAPSSYPRIDIVYLNTANDTIGIITGDEGASPTPKYSSMTADYMPLALIYLKTTSDRILNYEDKDTDSTEAYIYEDIRPFINVGGGVTAPDFNALQDTLMLIGFRGMVDGSKLFQLFEDGWADEFTDGSGIGTATNATLSAGKYANSASDACTVGSAVSGGDGASATDSIPTMSSNNAPSGVASASTEYNASYYAYKAMDKNNATYWLATATTGWLKYDFGSAKLITGYSVQGPETPLSKGFKSWTFEGSNTGAFAGEQTTLDTQTNVSAWSSATEVRNYSFANTTAFRYYRWNVTANQGHSSYLSTGEVQLFESLDKANAFDDSNSTFWASSQTSGTVSGNAYIGYNFGSGKVIKQFSIKQHASDQAVNSVKIEGSANGSDWTLIGTHGITADTTKQTVNVTNSTSYQYYRLRANAETTSGSWQVEEVEFMEAPGNITLISISAITPSSAPSEMKVILLEKDVDACTINTDYQAYVSRDNGTTWNQITLVNEGEESTGMNICAGSILVTDQPSGTQPKFKITSANNKFIEFHAVALLCKL